MAALVTGSDDVVAFQEIESPTGGSQSAQTLRLSLLDPRSITHLTADRHPKELIAPDIR